MSILRVQLLGDFEVRYQDVLLNGFDAPRLQSLLAYLLLHHDAPQSRKHLAFLLWQDSSEKQAHNNLRNLVYLLRKALPDVDRFLAADTQTLQWRADAPFSLDVDEFVKRATDAGRQTAQVVAPPVPDSHRAQQLATAVNLYRGDLMPACYDEWLLPERERLRELYVDTLAQLIALSEEIREIQNAIGYARRLLQADPLSEDAYRKLMSLYAESGDRANVVRVYQTCVAVLQRELDTEPSATTRELFERLRRQEKIVERAITPRVQTKSNLPMPLTSFIGRARELAEIRAQLERARLVTLTGVGGGGKTRLAIQAAHEIANDFSDGAWFVDLAPLTDAAEVPSACAAVFGLREHVDTGIRESFFEYARDRSLLLVLDNCEHLHDACAVFARDLLQHAPRVSIIATSREPLNVLGEALIVVPPLSLPDAEHPTFENVSHSDAAQLFITRASFILPTFSLNQHNLESVAQICRRLDGIPLAIELAAARVRTLSPQQIAARLDDALAVLTRGSSSLPARHQTMRAVLDWSDALLSPDERVLFRRLSVFSGGFTLQAAEAVVSDEKPVISYQLSVDRGQLLNTDYRLRNTEILDTLSNLIDKSLVMVNESDGEMRYRMLEPLREYAREKLHVVQEDDELAARHLAYFMELAERAEPEFTGAEQGAWHKRLEAEHDNVRAALSWHAQTQEHIEMQLRLAGALWRFWYARGHIVEGQRFLTNALGQGEPTATPARAKGYAGLGSLAWLRGEYEPCIQWHEQALAINRELGDIPGVGLALVNIAGALIHQTKYEKADRYLEESLAVARGLQDHLLLTFILMTTGELARYRGDYANAQALDEEAYAAATQAQHVQHIALALNNLGLVATRQGNFARAIQLHQESLQMYRTGSEIRFVPECLEGLAAALDASGDSNKAAILLGASDALRESIALPIPQIDRPDYERVLESVRAHLNENFSSAWAVGRAMTMEQATEYGLGG
jgi:predicted ATPase/DNA-binding SARP family transcriptional activator